MRSGGWNRGGGRLPRRSGRFVVPPRVSAFARLDRKKSVPFKDGQNFDPLLREPIDDPVVSQEDLSDLFKTELRDHAARLRNRSRLAGSFLELVDPAACRWGIVASDKSTDFAEIS